MHLRFPHLLLVDGGAGEPIKVAPMILPCFITLPSALRWAWTTSKDLLAQIMLLKQVPEPKIVVSLGIRLLKISFQANRRSSGTSISESSIAESLKLYYYLNSGCTIWPIAERGPFNLGAVLGIVQLNQIK